MNRRSFINNLLVAGASFAILPGAGRIWRATRAPVIQFVNAPLPEVVAEYQRVIAAVMRAQVTWSKNFHTLPPRTRP